MKRIERDSFKYLLLLLVIYIILGLILYPVLDFLYCKLITRSSFVYSVQADIIKPSTLCSLMAICSWLIEKKRK